MYYDPVATDPAVITVTAGDSAAFYPAPTPLRDRTTPGLRFQLAPGEPWQWTGPDGQADASLTDVLAAVNTARLVSLPGYEDIDPAAVHAAHGRAAHAALAAGDTALAGRLLAEQSEIASAALVGEEEAARRLGITGRSLNNLRLAYRTICPPVLIAGDQRTKWFWAPAQFGAWQAARPGKGWRLGHTASATAGATPAGASGPR
jgi:hypothetical protein